MMVKLADRPFFKCSDGGTDFRDITVLFHDLNPWSPGGSFYDQRMVRTSPIPL